MCSYVVLRNTVHSDSFPLFENTVIRKRLLKELGAKEIPQSANRLLAPIENF